MGMFQDRMDQRSAQMALDNAAWRMRISHSRGSREAAQMQGDAARERLQGLESRKLQGMQNEAQVLASMRAPEGQAPDFGDMPSGGGAPQPQPQPLMSTGSSEASTGISPGMQHTLDLAAAAGSQPMGADFAKNLGLEGYVPQKINMLEWTKGGPLGWAKGGPVRGPRGLDQVPTQMPDGSPARLSAGEYVQPREEVVAYAMRMLGERAKGLTEEQLNEIGLKLLSQRTEEVTGRKPGPEMVRPLAGQGQEVVPGMAGGSGDRLSAIKNALVAADRLQQDVEGAPTFGTKLHAALTRAPGVLYGAGKDLTIAGSVGLSHAAAPAVDFVREVVTGNPTKAANDTTPAQVPTPQADPRARAIARDMATQRPQTEQDLLNQITPQGARLTRQGRVFRYEDPAAMQPGRASPVEPRVIRGRGGVPIEPRDSFPVVNGWEAPNGRTSLAMAAKRDHTYDHLPISGVTLSDSPEGTALGQVRSPKVTPQVATKLDQLYEQDAIRRAAARQVMGMDPRPELVNRPAVSEQQAGNLGALRRGLDLARIQTQAQKPVDQGKAAKEARDAETHLRWQQENFMKDAEPVMQRAASDFSWLPDGGASYFQRASTLGRSPFQVLNILDRTQQVLGQSKKPLFSVAGQDVTGIDAIKILNGERPLDPRFWFGPGDEFYDEARRLAAEKVQDAALQELAQ